MANGRRPAVSFLKEQGKGRWRLSGTSPSLGARRLNSLDPFLSHLAAILIIERNLITLIKIILTNA